MRRYLLSNTGKMKSHLFALPIHEEKGLKMILKIDQIVDQTFYTNIFVKKIV